LCAATRQCRAATWGSDDIAVKKIAVVSKSCQSQRSRSITRRQSIEHEPEKRAASPANDVHAEPQFVHSQHGSRALSVESYTPFPHCEGVDRFMHPDA